MPLKENSVQEVIDGVKKYLSDTVSYSTAENYAYPLAQLYNYYMRSGITVYSTEISNKFLIEQTENKANGLISHYKWLAINRTVYLANQWHERGGIVLGTNLAYRKKKLADLSDANKLLLSNYENYLTKRNLRTTTVQKESYDVALFLRFLEEKSIVDPRYLTAENVVECIPYLRKFRKDIGNEVASVRRFLEFLVTNLGINEYLPKALYVSSTHHKRVIPGFSKLEVEKLLNAVDRTSVTGKRDYAIMLLAHETGLRAIDIKNMLLSDVKWREAEIHVISSKSQKARIIPLMRNVGDAISDYVLNGRPITKSPYLFIRTNRPYEKLTGQLNVIVKKYAAISGIQDTTKACIGMHAFRRGLGTSLLEAEVPLSIISEVLEHTRQNTTKRYLSIDLDGLGICAMPMHEYQNHKES